MFWFSQSAMVWQHLYILLMSGTDIRCCIIRRYVLPLIYWEWGHWTFGISGYVSGIHSRYILCSLQKFVNLMFLFLTTFMIHFIYIYIYIVIATVLLWITQIDSITKYSITEYLSTDTQIILVESTQHFPYLFIVNVHPSIHMHF